jgi:hypothetical protein
MAESNLYGDDGNNDDDKYNDDDDDSNDDNDDGFPCQHAFINHCSPRYQDDVTGQN